MLQQKAKAKEMWKKFKFKIAVKINGIAVRMLPRKNEKPDGIPYVRDYDAQCEFYEPWKKGYYQFNNCLTDGHYLCEKCCHKDKEAK